ncbi:MAG: SDR family oxidoreductase [Chloroflexi bacterium]|nr:SDR family oxidoreductase [Chloroflexota bacterium]
MTLDYDLRGHAALVTGAGRRLGEAFARALARAGCAVCLHYGATPAEELAAELGRAHRVRTAALQADLADAQAAAALVDRAADVLGPIDLLVNSASIFEPLDFAATGLADWQRHLAVNLTAPFLISQSFARRLGSAPGASVNLLDWRALRPGPDHFAYTISKAGLAAMTTSLAQALAPSIRVNGLALGAVLPPAGGAADDAPAAAAPLGRWATLAETTDALLFLLAGPDFITGEILHLDGGRHLT